MVFFYRSSSITLSTDIRVSRAGSQLKNPIYIKKSIKKIIKNYRPKSASSGRLRGASVPPLIERPGRDAAAEPLAQLVNVDNVERRQHAGGLASIPAQPSSLLSPSTVRSRFSTSRHRTQK